MIMPILETERLQIRPLTMDDLTAVHQLHIAINWINEDETAAEQLETRRQWLHWNSINHIEQAKLHQPPYGDRAVVHKETAQLIGVCGLVPSYNAFSQLPYFGNQENGRYHPEVGLMWAISPNHQRHGFAAEAAQALIDFAFSSMNLHRIVATTEFDNIASQAVMRRLGMIIEKNPFSEPPWLQVVGILENSAAPE